MHPFLGQVPIRSSGLHFLGQNAPPWSIEREIKKKELECYALRLTYNNALAKYYQEDTPAEYYEEILEPARQDLNLCVAELQELIDTADYGPRIPVAIARGLEWKEPEPAPTKPSEGGETEQPAPEPAAIVPWPSEVPEPTTAPVPSPEEAEPQVQPQEEIGPQSCDTSKGEFYDPRLQQCRSSVSRLPSFNAFGPATTTPLQTGFSASTTTPFSMSGRIPLSRGLGVRALGLF